MTTKEFIDDVLANNAFPLSTFVIKFNPDKHILGTLCNRGHAYKNTRQSVRGIKHRDCVICLRLNAIAWLRMNPERAKLSRKRVDSNPERKKRKVISRRKWHEDPTNRLKSAVWGAQRRKGISCDIDVPFMLALWEQQKGICHWLGVPMQPAGARRHPLKPSIDRLDSTKGYMRGNVVWATNFANRAKGDTPPDEFLTILHMLGIAATSQPSVSAARQ